MERFPTPPAISRRDLLAGGTAGLLLPRRLRAAPASGFTHGVASGEPSATSMLFWTRFQPADGKPAPLKLEIATDPRMARARVMAETHADPARDWTARATVEGLEPGVTYYYRWLGPGRNVRSITGRTRTLPLAATQFRLGVFSCSNLPFGWFNAYGHAVAADDIDLVLHLGDYIYEYPRGIYPNPAQIVAGRPIEPAGETIRREDYWARYRSYRADPDLQALHARFPSITTWDDHDIANDAWSGGAQNHDPQSEGRWADRTAAATAAYRDWLPVSDAPYARYDIGRLASLYRLDTRLAGRDAPLDIASAIRAGPNVSTALTRLRDEQWITGRRQMLGVAQERWLFAEMEQAARAGTRWQILAQQVVMGQIMLPPGTGRHGAEPQFAAWLSAAEAAARIGLPLNLDAWDGFPAARARLLAAARRLGADLVVLSGDSHNAWANDLLYEGRPAGVEFAGQSVSSPGFEASFRDTAPAGLASALMAANPALKWAETSGRGYMQVQITPAEAICEWRFTGPAATRNSQLSHTQRGRVRAHQRQLLMA